MEEVEFEGLKIKPSRGAYRCPWGCGNPGFPPPKWKTAGGFLKHLSACKNKPAPGQAKPQSRLFACGKTCPTCGDNLAKDAQGRYTCFTCGHFVLLDTRGG